MQRKMSGFLILGRKEGVNKGTTVSYFFYFLIRGRSEGVQVNKNKISLIVRVKLFREKERKYQLTG